jgi:hypothetical protein
VVLRVDRSAEHVSPEAARCGNLGGVEVDYLVGDVHAIITAAATDART